ncbi:MULTISPECIES: pilus assembly protein [Metallibacterium]|jgi:Flp pilus assembly pilin Flp|uniref:pilus assembly protein n=1 Tax=Metallibacterium TaxID=1218803 RepID=UPI002621E86D|nr:MULTISPECIES: pilus assembly protein [Metallibacterium]
MMLKNSFDKRLSGRRLQRGQGMTEYIIIVALVAIAAIAVYSWFGGAVRGQMASITSQLSGGGGTTGQQYAQNTARANANIEGTTQYGLNNYTTSAKHAGQ